MNKKLFLNLGFCLLGFSFCLYFCLNKQNELTKLKIKLPELAREVKGLKEEVVRLQYQVDQFESPAHLMELALSPEYSHLKHPILTEILTISEGVALQETRKTSLSVVEEAR